MQLSLIFRLAYLGTILNIMPVELDAFVIESRYGGHRRNTCLHADPASLRVAEIKAELKDRNIDFSDCFDKESLVAKLKNARDSGAQKETAGSAGEAADDSRNTSTQATTTTTTEDSPDSSTSRETLKPTSSATTATKSTDSSSSTQQSQQQLLDSLYRKPVKELRQELANRNLRWAGFLDKQDLVKAVFEAMQKESSFSATGLMRPGQVVDMSEADLRREMEAVDVGTPLLVDVYATWCGPCQIMATQLEMAAQTWGDSLRVAKLDSDRYPQLSSELKVQGLPTLLLFRHGKQVKRMEGAMMRDQLVQWVKD